MVETVKAPSPEDIAAAAHALGFTPGPEACRNLALYLGLLVKWNAAMNLVGPRTWREIFDSLIVDSLHLAHFLPKLPLGLAPRCLDLGAGAGLPGIALRMLWQQGEYCLVEAREKRTLFLRAVLAACPLPGVSVFQGRAQSLLEEHGGGDLLVSRAFMPWQQVLDLVQDHCRVGALCIFLANAPLSKTPHPWLRQEQASYLVAGKTRYLWALRKV